MLVIRYGLVGVVNTAIDFAVLNILVVVFGIVSGFPLLLCNAVAFLVANLNSYFLNKKWTFQEKSNSSLRQYLYYMALTIGGLVINCIILYLIVSVFPSPAMLAPGLWVNVAKVAATAASMVWNYLVCRYFVFKSYG